MAKAPRSKAPEPEPEKTPEPTPKPASEHPLGIVVVTH